LIERLAMESELGKMSATIADPERGIYAASTLAAPLPLSTSVAFPLARIVKRHKCRAPTASCAVVSSNFHGLRMPEAGVASAHESARGQA